MAAMFWLIGVGLGFIAVRDAPYAALPDSWRRALPLPLRKTVGRVLVGALVGVGPHLLLAVPYPTVANSIGYLRHVAGGATFGVLAAVVFLTSCAVTGWAITASNWLYRTARKRVTR